MTKHFPALDGLRAIAVGIVLVAHAGFRYPRSGGVGVDMFFVLSGFLITGILAREHQQYGSIRWRLFYLRRLLRLSPCLVAAVVLFCVLESVEEGRIRMDIVGICLTYTANYAKALFDYDLRSMTHCWSLAIEEQYYLAWPLVVVGLERFSKRNGTKFLLLLACALGAALYRSAMVGTFSPRRIFFALDTHVDGLVMGSALSYLVAELGSNEPRWRWVLRWVSGGLVPLAVTGLAVVACFLYWGNPWMGRAGFVLVAAASSVVILDLVSAPRSMLRPVLEFPALVYLGRISYGLYLYHYPIYHFVGSRFSDSGFPTRVVLMLASTLLVAAVSYHTLESAFLGLKVRFARSDGRQSGTGDPPA